MSIKENISVILKERGISISFLARKIGLEQRTFLYQLEKEYPNLETLYKIAEALEVPVSCLLGENKSYIICPHCHKAIIIEGK